MTNVAETKTVEVSTVDEAILALKRELIDRGVRAARSGGWCSEFERSMAVIFREGPPEGDSDWYDSDGFTCRGYDREGRNPDGYDVDGYDRDGYDHNGRNIQGLDRNGFNRYGYDADGYDREGFNPDGVNRQGVDLAGHHVDSPEHQVWLYRFDVNGYDADGFDYRGIHCESRLSRSEHARRFQYDRNGNLRPAA